MERSQRKAIMLAVNISKLVRHPALVAKREKCCMTNPDGWYQTPPTFVARRIKGAGKIDSGRIGYCLRKSTF